MSLEGGREGGREGKLGEGRERGGREGERREGRDDCYIYYSDGPQYLYNNDVTYYVIT